MSIARAHIQASTPNVDLEDQVDKIKHVTLSVHALLAQSGMQIFQGIPRSHLDSQPVPLEGM